MPTALRDDERILHVLASPRPDRLSLIELLLADAQRRGSAAAVASTDHSLAEPVNSFGAAFHRLPVDTGGTRSTLRNAAALRGLVTQLAPSVVHLHDPEAGAAMRIGSVGIQAPPVVLTVQEGEVSYARIGRLLNRTSWTAIASGPTVGHALRSNGYHGRLRTMLSGGAWSDPSLDEVSAARVRWGLTDPYVLAWATAQTGPTWPALLDGLRRFEGVRLAVVGDPVGDAQPAASDTDRLCRWVPAPHDFEALAAGSLGVISPLADRPTAQILGPLSIGVPVVAGRNPALQGSVPTDAAIVIDYAPDSVAAAIEMLFDPSQRRMLGARGRDAARVWGAHQTAVGYASLYQSRAATHH